KELLARQEEISRGDLDASPHAPEDAVERALVAHDELTVAVEEVGVPRRHVRVVGEHELPVAADEVLLGVELVAQALDAFATDENELGLARRLQLAEELRARVHDVRRNRGPAATAK